MDEMVILLSRLPVYPLVVVTIALNTLLYCLIFSVCLLRYGFVFVIIFVVFFMVQKN